MRNDVSTTRDQQLDVRLVNLSGGSALVSSSRSALACGTLWNTGTPRFGTARSTAAKIDCEGPYYARYTPLTAQFVALLLLSVWGILSYFTPCVILAVFGRQP